MTITEPVTKKKGLFKKLPNSKLRAKTIYLGPPSIIYSIVQCNTREGMSVDSAARMSKNGKSIKKEKKKTFAKLRLWRYGQGRLYARQQYGSHQATCVILH